MTATARSGRLTPVLVAAVVATAGAGLAATAERRPALALINESPSLPRGLYVRGPGREPRRGDITAVPQPSAARPYLASLGMPDDVLLIKRVVAIGGDRVCAAGGVVLTPGRRIAARTRDDRGMALPVWEGCRRLASDELFLLGDTASSFDSRYFGPVRRSEATGLYREVLTW